MSDGAEFPRLVPAQRLGPAGLTQAITADPAECAAVARRLMLPSVARLSCNWTLRLGPRGLIIATGDLEAEVEQICVVTLEPFKVPVTDRFEVHFVLTERDSDFDDPDEPDEIPYDGVAVDLGEAAVEQLALVLDPYPRGPLADSHTGLSEAPAAPFAALAKLHGRH